MNLAFLVSKIAIALPYSRAHGSRPFLYAKRAHFPHSFRILRHACGKLIRACVTEYTAVLHGVYKKGTTHFIASSHQGISNNCAHVILSYPPLSAHINTLDSRGVFGSANNATCILRLDNMHLSASRACI